MGEYFDEVYACQKDVEQDPCGALMAIHEQAARIEALQAERDQLRAWDDYFRLACGYKRDGRSSPECLDEKIRNTQAERDAAVLAEREVIADWCYHHTMDTVTDARKAEYAGSYVAGEYSPESGARHHGMGYAAAILARSNKEPEQ